MSLKRAGHAQFIGNVPDGGLVLSFFEDRVILVLHHEVAHVQWHGLLYVFGQEVGNNISATLWFPWSSRNWEDSSLLCLLVMCLSGGKVLTGRIW